MKEQKDKLAELLSGMIDGLETSDIREMIEIPPDSSMGDFAFPCFRLAKTMRKAPQMIAADLAEKLAGNEAFSKVENVNAYVNFFMNKAEVAGAAVAAVIKAGAAYGGSDQGNGKTVCIDYSSPNIAKP